MVLKDRGIDYTCSLCLPTVLGNEDVIAGDSKILIATVSQHVRPNCNVSRTARHSAIYRTHS